MNLKQILYQVYYLQPNSFDDFWERWHNDPQFLNSLQDHLNKYQRVIPDGFQHRVEGWSDFPENMAGYDWKEGEDEYYYAGDLVNSHAKLAGLYAKSITGGYETKVEYLTFKLTNGWRGMGIDSIIAFDSTGRGCLFIKR